MLLFAVINLSNLTSQSTRKLWAAVNSKYRGHDSRIPKYISADCLNDFFAKISTGQHPNSEVYHSSAVKCDVEISEHQIEKILRCVKRTSTGWDGLPSWLFKKCSVELAPVVTHLKNYSINEGQIPDIWRTARVTPVPELTQPAACNDYRPISVTPILSRITERIIVNRWLRPSIRPELLLSQYAYRPTGSTTAALVHIFHSLTRILENSAYVRAILIDFTKALT